MQDKYYLLSISALQEASQSDEGKRACGLIDRERLERIQNLKPEKRRAEILGAGLLLQLAVRQAEDETAEGAQERRDGRTGIDCPGLPMLLDYLESMGPPLELKYLYGERGKPYLENYPFYFTISHSAGYVFCAVSDREVGADLQRRMNQVRPKLAERYFSKEENAFLEQCAEREEWFYRLWCRKEAYGKLTGEGISSALGRNMLSENAVIFEEYETENNYQITVCKWKQERYQL